jgi:hypothetical protein
VRKRWAAGEPALGAWLTIPSSFSAETMAQSPPGFSLPCGAIRAWLSLATVRALTWRLGAWRPRSATVSMDSGEHGLPRLSFSLVWDSSDNIQEDSNRRSSLWFLAAYERLEVSAGSLR